MFSSFQFIFLPLYTYSVVVVVVVSSFAFFADDINLIERKKISGFSFCHFEFNSWNQKINFFFSCFIYAKGKDWDLMNEITVQSINFRQFSNFIECTLHIRTYYSYIFSLSHFMKKEIKNYFIKCKFLWFFEIIKKEKK